MTNPEVDGGTAFVYDAANRQITGLNIHGGLFTNTFDSNGNLSVSLGPAVSATMAYDKENRMISHLDNLTGLSSYSYDSFGKKRTELVDSTVTTLVWDGEDYLQGRQP